MSSISIITCCYNSVETLEDTHASIIGLQDKSSDIKFDWIVVDSSEDDSVKRFVELSELDWSYYYVPPTGIYPAMNYGAKYARGEYIWFLNSDDFINYDAVNMSRLQQKLDSNAHIFFGRVQWISKNDQSVVATSSFNPLYWISHLACYPPHPATIVKRQIFNEYGGFDENLSISADFDMFLKIVRRSNMHIDRSAYEKSLLVSMRMGGNSSNGLITELIKIYQDIRSLRKNRYSIIYVLLKRLTKSLFLICGK